MLCQTKGSSDSSAFTITPVVSGNNLYRGQFRRIVTIGSPQNGTLIMYYLSKLPLSIAGDLSDKLLELAYFVSPAVEKFNPDGQQIKLINDTNFPVDSRIPFHCIQSTIDSGQAPVAWPWLNPAFYDILHLNDLMLVGPYANNTRGNILIPKGSDGVVDLVSQGEEAGTQDSYDFELIAHAIGGWLFRVGPNDTETASASVGYDVAALLKGPVSRFGPFVLPQIISQADKDKYNAIIPSIQTMFGLIQAIVPLDGSTNINYVFDAPTNLPPGGPINWEAVVYSTNGISTNGLTVSVSTSNSALMTLTVDSNVVGQVVVSADYMAANGDVVFAVPVVAVSRPFAYGATLTNIVVQPSAIGLQVGDTIPTHVLGDYSNGSQAVLYVPPGQISYTSSNPQVAAVDTNGNLTLMARDLLRYTPAIMA